MAVLLIKELCKEHGITQKDLAEQIGITRVSIGNINAGRQSPTLNTLEKIADAFGVKVYDLFQKEDDPEPNAVCPHCGRPIKIIAG